MHFRVVEACPRRRVEVVSGVLVRVGEVPGLSSETAAPSLTSNIMRRDQSSVEPGSREHIFRLIHDSLMEHCP